MDRNITRLWRKTLFEAQYKGETKTKNESKHGKTFWQTVHALDEVCLEKLEACR